MFAGTGFWDTFRALYPFLNLVYPSINREMQEGLANDFKEGGWLPEWSSPGYANVMVGNNSASVVAEAWLKGLRGYDIETLWQALVHGANNAGPMEAVGRAGVEDYKRLGYVPYDAGINESAARTLEYAYDDFAIYQLGKALGKPESEIAVYAERARNYRKLYDPEHGPDAREEPRRQLPVAVQPVQVGRRLHRGEQLALHLVGVPRRGRPGRPDGRAARPSSTSSTPCSPCRRPSTRAIIRR
jgi:putative alpha-1,2-mannosidase